MPTKSEKVMLEAIANIEALVDYAVERVAQPPRGPAAEVGHYRTLNGLKLNARQREALRTLLEETAFNVAISIFALLDNALEVDIEEFPDVAVVEKVSGQPLAPSLAQAFERLWNEGAGEE
ncbi:MAG: hypothetical protein M5U01_40090 [Ardenticatenaceae bacterium]|nr:hypothetical protein [Ardenticatenaceae bacterium]